MPPFPEFGPPYGKSQELIAILENNFRLCTSVIPANAGIQGELGPGVRRDDGNVPFGRNFGEML